LFLLFHLLALANGAEKGGTLGLHDADYLGRAALQTGVTGALIYAVFVLIISRFIAGDAIGAVAERGALMTDGLSQHFSRCGVDGRPVARFQFIAGLRRVDARAVQYFRCV
jgi:hypothetical protein